MAAMPSNQASSAIDAGRASMARSKSSATDEHLADEVLAGEPELALALLGRSGA